MVIVYFPGHERIFPSQHPKKSYCLILMQTSWDCCGWPSVEGETLSWLWHLFLEVIVVSWQQCTYLWKASAASCFIVFSLAFFTLACWSSSFVLSWCGTMLLQDTHWQSGAQAWIIGLLCLLPFLLILIKHKGENYFCGLKHKKVPALTKFAWLNVY